MKEEDVEREDEFEDEVKPEDGRLRSWTFFNGEQYRLFAALAAAFLGVVWAGLYVFGAGQSILGTVLLVLALLSFGSWRFLEREVRRYQERGWRKDEESPRREKIELRVAIGLWLFIFVSVGLILLRQWWRVH